MALRTLRRMADGGIRDQLGGGFHRYAVDAIWLVPHFEQMLYDNALLARAYLAAWQVTGDEQWRDVAEGVLGYMLRELALEHGGFASAQDADTDGVEGATFTWTPAQLRGGALRRGRRARGAHLGRDRGRQFRGRDRALAGGRAGRRRTAAPGSRACARSCSRREPAARSPRSTTRRWRAGTAWRWPRSPRAPASPAAPTCLPPRSAAPPSCSGRSRAPTAGSGGRIARAAARCRASSTTTRRSRSDCTSCYLATRDHRYLVESRRLALLAVERFGAPDGAFFDTAHDAEQLVARPREFDDNPTP